MSDGAIRLTSLAHGGGCGCKLSPAVLRDLLAGVPAMRAFPDLLVGNESSDDAAVYRINDSQAVVVTTDFFMPIIDDPFDFGRIAAANALSDVYAMGGRPILALAILGMPLGKIDPKAVQSILAGGASICAEAGIPVAGGHSIDAPEPIYGLAVVGLVHPDCVARNTGARPGDALILTKGLGVGVISAALKGGALDPDMQHSLSATLVASTIQLNAVGPALAALDGLHAMTDVTGFGLLGHCLELCRGSSVSARLHFKAVPLLEGVAGLARVPHRTGAAVRNWASYGGDIALAAGMPEWQRDLLCDPQTSGGLLLAVAPEGSQAILALLRAEGFGSAAVIGEVSAGAPVIEIA